MATTGRASRTFGPGLAYWLGIPLVIAAAGAGAWFLLTRAEPDPARAAFCALLAILAAATMVRGWARYHVDAEGLEVESVRGRTRWTWREIGGVHGDAYTVRSRSGVPTTSVRRTVLAPDRSVLFRVSPWTKGKRELVRWIRQHAAGLPAPR